MSKRDESRKRNSLKKYKTIQLRYQHLYNVERLRLDDVIKQLCKEFFLSEQSIMRALREVINDDDITDSDPAQLKMFDD